MREITPSTEAYQTPSQRAAMENVQASTNRHDAEAALAEQKSRELRSKMAAARQKAHIEKTDAVRKSLHSPHPFGKDCSSGGFCYPYIAKLQHIVWGIPVDEPITPKTEEKFREASDRAMFNLLLDINDFSFREPVVPNLVSGLPLPFTFYASLSTLSADRDQPYWFWRHTIDPLPGKPKKGKVVWDCRDLQGNLMETKTVHFKEYDTVALSCDDVATKFSATVSEYLAPHAVKGK
jgi:hypothetical protein